MDQSSLSWRKSSASGGGAATNCVEVAAQGGAVFVRDSKSGGGPMLGFQSPRWASFLARLSDGTGHNDQP